MVRIKSLCFLLYYELLMGCSLLSSCLFCRCQCGHCREMSTNKECICCREIDTICQKMLKSEGQIDCITDHDGFEAFVSMYGWCKQHTSVTGNAIVNHQGNCSWVRVPTMLLSECTCEIYVLFLGSIGSLLITNWYHGAGIGVAEMLVESCQVVQ